MDEYDLYSEFDIEKHKAKYINYLEVLIEPNGHVLYAVPSHQELAIKLACKVWNKTRQQIYEMCPPEMYFDFLPWLLNLTGCISVWNNMYVGDANAMQVSKLRELKDAGLYKGSLIYGMEVV